MTVVPAQDSFSEQYSQAVPLALYAQVIGYDECAFWGVARTDDNGVACHDPCFSILRKWERDKVRRYLVEAQHEIEQETGFYLAPTYTADEILPWRPVLRARNRLVIEPGVMATTDIGAANVVNASTDPLVYTIAAPAGVTDETEIHVYHPNTESEISPSDITISGGTITVTIPRCRCIADEDNPRGGWDYNDDTRFESTVDVTRIYTDDSESATINCKPKCRSCSGEAKTACIYVKNARLGTLVASPATYSSGTWTKTTCSCCCPNSVTVNYLSGMSPTTNQAVDAVIKLAHSKAPTSWCSCSFIDQIWKDDRKVPDTVTRERVNNPFGINNGAWVAYKFADAMRIMRGSTL